MARVILDDRNPLIVYSAGWHAGGISPDYNSTTMYTLNRGTTAMLTFNGTSVAVYGAIASGDSNGTAPQSQYQLDGYDPVVYQATVTSQFQFNQLFYQSPQVAKDQHTLVVTNLINASNSFILDYFVILTEDTTISTPNKTASRSSIIAGSLGGIIGCILLILGVFFFLRRRRRKLDETVDSNVDLAAWSGSSPAILNPPYSGPGQFTSPPASTTMTSGITLTEFSTPSTSKRDLPPPQYSVT